MKNRKFIGDGLEATAWDIETYTSKLFDKGIPKFWAEFTYTTGHSVVNWNLKETKNIVQEMTKFINEATKKEAEFSAKHKKKVKK